MQKSANSKDSTTLTRASTAALIVSLIGSACGISWVVSTAGEKAEKRTAVESVYIEANGCVMAQMDGRGIAKYRCDKPETRYLSAAELWREAQAGAEKK